MSVALSCHLAEVGLAGLLDFCSAHLGLNATDECILSGVIASESSLLNLVLDLVSSQQLSLLDDFVGALLQLLAQRAKTLSWRNDVRVVHDGMGVLVSDVVLHPVDVEGTGLGAVD